MLRILFIYIYIYIQMDHLRHQKYKNKQLENNFKPINISINGIDKFEKKRTNKEENIYKKHFV